MYNGKNPKDYVKEYKMIIETYTERSKAFLEAKKEETA
jgi:hypothetical protein